jgi:hypothetical protein
MELKADGVGGEGTARQPRPLDRALFLFDVLLAGAAVVVEADDALGRPRQVGDDEADARTKLTRMSISFARIGAARSASKPSSAITVSGRPASPPSKNGRRLTNHAPRAAQGSDRDEIRLARAGG